MIVAGDNNVFAIAAEVTEIPQGWLLGRFRFVFHGHRCGNWEDETDLRACFGWLKDFAEKPRPRFEEDLVELPAEEVFSRLVAPVINQLDQAQLPERYQGTFARFHISHLGMSSFDKVSMVLLESLTGQRCIWKEGDSMTIQDHRFPAGHMQEVASQFCLLLQNEAKALGVAL